MLAGFAFESLEFLAIIVWVNVLIATTTSMILDAKCADQLTLDTKRWGMGVAQLS